MLPPMSPRPLARRERLALCDEALAQGEDAPTLCGDWTAKDLVAHCLVREYHPVAAAGLVLPPLASFADREVTRLARTDFNVLVERLRRRGPTVFSVPLVDRVFNTLEYFVHHEDVRRAQTGWRPRELPAEDEDTLWSAISTYGKGLVRPAGVPVVIRRSDTGATATLRRGSDPVVMTGRPSEIALRLFGREQVTDVTLEGPPDRVEQFRSASFGV